MLELVKIASPGLFDQLCHENTHFLAWPERCRVKIRAVVVPTWYSVAGRGRAAPFTGSGRGGGSVVVLILLMLLQLLLLLLGRVHLIVSKLMVLIVTNMVVVLVCKLSAVLIRNVVYGLAIRSDILNFSYCLGGGGHLEQ